jgi:hypothetical protein
MRRIDGSHVCFVNPPQAGMIPEPQKFLGSNPGLRIIAVRPPVQPTDTACKLFKQA